MSVFKYEQYKKFVIDSLKRAHPSRGARSRLAKAIGCHPAYISQVLEGRQHFTLEQAFAVTRFFQLGADESDFFMLLVHRDRAGTAALRRYYEEAIQRHLSSRNKIVAQVLKPHELELMTQATYYSSWHYVAIHILASVPKFRTREALARQLLLPLPTVSRFVAFLISAGVLSERKNAIELSQRRIHLSPDSPLIAKHHANWRMRAIESLDDPKERDLHFSTLYSFSESTAEQIRSRLLDLIKDVETVALPSNEEVVHCLSFDYFQIG